METCLRRRDQRNSGSHRVTDRRNPVARIPRGFRGPEGQLPLPKIGPGTPRASSPRNRDNRRRLLRQSGNQAELAGPGSLDRCGSMRAFLKLRSVCVGGDQQWVCGSMFGQIGRGAVSHREISDQTDRKLSRALVTLRIFSAPLRFLRGRYIVRRELAWKEGNRGGGEKERRAWAVKRQ